MSKVVSERVVGSANPVAKFFRGLGDSIKGILTGLLFIVISFVLVWFMVTQKEHSKTIAELPLLDIEQAEGKDGMLKVQGEPTYSLTVNEPKSGKDVLYYRYTKEDYALRRKQRTETTVEDGQEIERTIEYYEPEWRSVSDATEEKWSEFSLGEIKIDPKNADTPFNEETLFESGEIPVDYDSFRSDEELVDVPQKYREKVVGVTVGGEIIVVGENSSNRISSGQEGTFFVSNKSAAELLADQESKERTIFWVMAVIAWFLMAQGFTMLLGPITHVMNIIPGLGSLTRGLLFFVFAIVSAIIIFIAYIGLKFWWIILLVVLGYLAFATFNKARKGEFDEKALKKEAKASAKK